jgi:D-3-phosphoglycerate dehydrogenase
VKELAADAAAFIVRSETKITSEVFKAASLLKVVGRAGVGVDNVDVDAATENGVVVMNTPGGNTIATAELTFTHMLCGARPVPQAAASMKEGKWDRKSFGGIELHKKTLGVIGLGRIGGEVARRAQAFGMRVLAFDPYLSPSRAKAMQVECVDLELIFAESDYITVHMPLTSSTQNMIDADAFAKMKKGVRIFNCARGGLIDESALVDAIKNGTVAAAGLDVFETEPLPKDHVLRTLPQVTLTPHLGASTAEAQESVGVEIAEAVAEVLAGGAIRNAVNLPSLDAASVRALTPYLELGKKLGTLVQQLGPSQVEKLSLTYWGRMVDLDSDSITRGITRGFLQRISGDAVNFVNAPVLMKRLGIEVEVTKSSGETEYTELIEVEATSGGTVVASAAGTFVGKGHLPRVVTINGRPVEASLDGTMLILENHDEPGIVGFVGTVLGRHKINIASMSLGRNEAGGTAFTVLNLDTVPSDEAMAEIEDSDSIKSAVIVDL